MPIVYSLSTCPSSIKLREDWAAEGIEFEERLVDENQEWLDEALNLGDMVPIILRENGDVEIGYKGMIG